MDYENNGRPRVYTGQTTPLQTFAVRLTTWHIRKARRRGNGNVGEGIRQLIEEGADKGIDTVPRPTRLAL